MDKRTEQAIEERAKIRDQFAMNIMTGLMAACDYTDLTDEEARNHAIDDFLPMSIVAYKAAMAMMAVRAHWISQDCQDLSSGIDVTKEGLESGMVIR